MKLTSILDDVEQSCIRQYKADVNFLTLMECIDENLYVIPENGRKYRWSKVQIENLVMSLLYGLPIPPIYTSRNKKNQLEILDGRQRVMSLFFYYIGYYLNKQQNNCVSFDKMLMVDETFQDALLKLPELEELHLFIRERDKEAICVDYNLLPPELKNRIDHMPITIIEVCVDDEQKKAEVLQKITSNLNPIAVI